MVKILDNSYFFAGRFTDLILMLSSIEDKNLTVLEFIRHEKIKLQKSLN